MKLDNCVFLDPVPKRILVSYMKGADIGLMILANIPAFYYGTSPNKFFDYLSIGLPVLNNYPGWLANMIQEHDCGYVVEPEDPGAFAEGRNNYEIAARLEITRQKAGRWRNRFVEQGLAGIEKDAPRSGRIPTISRRKRARIVKKTLEEKPPNATHWSRASMAKAVGVSESTVGKIWRVHGLKPHLSRTFKLSNDKRFAEKLEDVVGLYLSPPENAIVLSCDEKSQMQALDRTQPGLPLKKGRCGTMTHDYKRNGTTTLFAALNILDGSVIGDPGAFADALELAADNREQLAEMGLNSRNLGRRHFNRKKLAAEFVGWLESVAAHKK